MIVVDTDVIASFWIRSARTESAHAARRRDPHWIAPILWRSEFRSVLRKYMVAGYMSRAQATLLAVSAERSMRRKEFAVESEAVLRLVDSTGHSSYDCEYVALAASLGSRLVTGDERLVRRFPDVCVRLEDFVP